MFYRHLQQCMNEALNHFQNHDARLRSVMIWRGYGPKESLPYGYVPAPSKRDY